MNVMTTKYMSVSWSIRALAGAGRDKPGQCRDPLMGILGDMERDTSVPG
jgi:hypothetical protein